MSAECQKWTFTYFISSKSLFVQERMVSLIFVSLANDALTASTTALSV
ncbi:Uncharacterised protein [Klebsiella pneumoniae]|nr:hypothetical protein P828_01897 [Klebsiella pneumoniae UCI 25]SBY46526.1 Uncharacterised protein [Klebsiella pneumoniae]SWT12840.1 Uncharacterised protein [Klebsiella pneumoniae]